MGWAVMTVIPRPASTVVLIDHMSRVYLTKRPATMKFLAGFYVFPGGAVEEGDYVVDHAYITHSISNEPFSSAHYIAAVREIFEEVGILFGSQGDGFPIQFQKETEQEYRRLLVNRDISFAQLLEQENIRLHLDCLRYFGHRITPKESAYRFDTRFFLAELPEGQTPKPDLNEIDKAFWIAPEEALLSYQNGNMLLAPPTVTALQTVINYQKGGALLMPR